MDGKKKDDDYAIDMSDINNRSSPIPRIGSAPQTGGLHVPVSQITNNPALSVAAYCLASISMTVINKYCVSGTNWNMNFFFLAFQVRAAASSFAASFLTVYSP